jgi:hypothetical protein
MLISGLNVGSKMNVKLHGPMQPKPIATVDHMDVMLTRLPGPSELPGRGQQQALHIAVAIYLVIYVTGALLVCRRCPVVTFRYCCRICGSELHRPPASQSTQGS